MKEKTYLKNPFNYTGAKFKLLSQLVPLFPNDIEIFWDIFGGSGEVGLNTKSNKLVYNEKNLEMSNLMKIISNEHLNCEFIDKVESLINEYNLTKTNKPEFLKLREDFNTIEYNELERAVRFYTLIAYSFNNQYSFNSKYKFNTPFGNNRSSFNPKMKENLNKYIAEINNRKIQVLNQDFREIDLSQFGKKDFVYLDPPYLITVGAYERDYHCKWSESLEKELLSFLDKLNEKGIKFGLSNVTVHKGKENKILQEWSKKYNLFYLKKDYANCNYQTHQTLGETKEVYICNY